MLYFKYVRFSGELPKTNIFFMHLFLKLKLYSIGKKLFLYLLAKNFLASIKSLKFEKSLNTVKNLEIPKV